MADVYGIQNTLVSLIAGVIYPNGTANPSVSGVNTYIYAGWPQPARLEQDLNAGGCHISVYPLTTEKKLTESLGRPWRTLSAGVSGIVATVSGQQITLSGTVTIPTNINLFCNRQHHTYAVQSGDTLTTIATALTVQIAGASNSGAVITLPASASFEIRIGSADTVGRILRRQEKDFQITVWAGSPDVRAASSLAVDNGLSALTSLNMSDGSPTVLRYRRSMVSDSAQSYLVYRHDLIFCVDYSSLQTAQATQVVAPTMNVRDNSNNLIKSIPE